MTHYTVEPDALVLKENVHTELDRAKGSRGERILSPDLCIMEVKALKSMPLWLSRALNDLKIFPGSFSKYGTAYTIVMQRKMNGGQNCA